MSSDEAWREEWRDLAALTTGLAADGPLGRRVLSLLEMGDTATAKGDIGMLRYVKRSLNELLTRK